MGENNTTARPPVIGGIPQPPAVDDDGWGLGTRLVCHFHFIFYLFCHHHQRFSGAFHSTCPWGSLRFWFLAQTLVGAPAPTWVFFWPAQRPNKRRKQCWVGLRASKGNERKTQNK